MWHNSGMMTRTHERQRIDATGGALRLAVVSDTHSQPHGATVAILRHLRPQAILHGGDVGDLAVLDTLAQVAPVIAVRGNIDSHAGGLPDAITLDAVVDGRSLRLLLTHIAVRGSHLLADAHRLARSEEADLVVCGHSHMPLIGRDGPLGIFNPGSCGPRRFRLPITVGLMEVRPDGLSLSHYDCETAAPWRPVPLAM